jgi:hypothetical protein
MTSEKSYSTEARLAALVARVAALEAAGIGADASWTDTGGLTASWGKGTGYFKYKFIATGVVMVAAQGLTVGTAADATTILSNANGLTSAYRPAGPKQIPATTNDIKTSPVAGTSFEGSWLEFETGGGVQCFGVGAAATFLNCFGIFTTDL